MIGVLLGLAFAQEPADQSLPLGRGLPLLVRTGVYFLSVDHVDDTSATFGATVDLRLTWDDLRLQYPASEAPSGLREFRTEAAEARLAEIWHPDIVISNLVGDPVFTSSGLRMYPTGKVEWMQRVQGEFAIDFDVSRFPFDRQLLSIDLVSRREPSSRLLLDFRQGEINFSSHARDIAVEGWEIGAVTLARSMGAGWYGQQQAELKASLLVNRDPVRTIPPIFIPLLASLLIPLLALWLNKTEEDGEFKVEAFELTNVLIGGLFALIALNFTINSTYPTLAAGNPVSLFFSLNYLVLAVNLLINIGLMRFGLVKRWFGPHVQREVYAWTVWALPASVVVAASAILLNAMV